MLLEHEILGDHRSSATGATQLRSRDNEVEQGQQEVLHASQLARRLAPRNVAQSGNSRENYDFETHRIVAGGCCAKNLRNRSRESRRSSSTRPAQCDTAT